MPPGYEDQRPHFFESASAFSSEHKDVHLGNALLDWNKAVKTGRRQGLLHALQKMPSIEVPDTPLTPP